LISDVRADGLDFFKQNPVSAPMIAEKIPSNVGHPFVESRSPDAASLAAAPWNDPRITFACAAVAGGAKVVPAAQASRGVKPSQP
jgi:hypothetical protein